MKRRIGEAVKKSGARLTEDNAAAQIADDIARDAGM